MALEAEEIILPGFLQNSSEDEIHGKMLDNLPEDIDKSEGGFPWDFTRPTAIEISELKEYVFVELLKSLFPSTCEESYLLDLHGQTRGLARRESVNAAGHVTVTAATGTVVPVGYMFSTEADEDGNTVSFLSTEEITVDSSGTASVPVEAEEGGTEGNVLPNTVVLQIGDEAGNMIEEITSVTNPEGISGGIDEEDDDEYRERIVDYDRSQDVSYIGNVQDYKRWAMSVSGVGAVTVIPSDDGSGLVTLVLTDKQGQPAEEDLCKEVYTYIMHPDNPEERLAPVGAQVQVIAPATMGINIAATVYLNDTTVAIVQGMLEEKLNAYFLSCITEGVIRISRMGAILSQIQGVSDYEGLTVSVPGREVKRNIILDEKKIPVIQKITLTEGDEADVV